MSKRICIHLLIGQIYESAGNTASHSDHTFSLMKGNKLNSYVWCSGVLSIWESQWIRMIFSVVNGQKFYAVVVAVVRWVIYRWWLFVIGSELDTYYLWGINKHNEEIDQCMGYYNIVKIHNLGLVL